MLTGGLTGMPFDLRLPGSQRSDSPRWNPLDRRIVVPKALGMGWTVNFGAAAVLIRLVRPDDEGYSFRFRSSSNRGRNISGPAVRTRRVRAAGCDRLVRDAGTEPMHWGVSGEADGCASRGTALLCLSVMAAAPVVVAGWVHLGRRQRLNRLGASALSLSLTVPVLAVLAQTPSWFEAVRGSGQSWQVFSAPWPCHSGCSSVSRDPTGMPNSGVICTTVSTKRSPI